VCRGRRDDVATITAYIEPGAKPAGAVADAGDATSGAAFLALTPAMTALMGIPILGELPSAIDWMAIRGHLDRRLRRQWWSAARPDCAVPVYQRGEDVALAVGQIEVPETTDQHCGLRR
jgi:hypothetical protein